MNRRALITSAVASAVALPALVRPARTEAKSAGLAPLALASGWIGTRPEAADLRGRVVLVDVFTFECINCVNVTPNLKRLYAAHSRADFAIVAVHTPEVPSYQSKIAYLAQQRRAAALPWPIAIDNASRIWNAYCVEAWPTLLLFDRAGRLRTTIVGDGRDAEVTAAVQSLVRET